MYKKLSKIVVASLVASPLAAQWQDCWQPQYGYNPSFWEECGQRFYLEVDYLLWYANQQGTTFGSTIDVFAEDREIRPAQFQSLDFKTKNEFFKTNWDSGVRAVVGYKPECRTWDVRFGYQYFSTQSTRRLDPVVITITEEVDQLQSLTQSEGSVFVVDYLPLSIFQEISNSVGTFTSTLSAKWCLNFNQADIEFGREYYLSEDVTFRPFFGMRGVWQQQKFAIHNQFDGVEEPETSPFINQAVITSSTSLDFTPKTRFDGFGVRVGFDTTVNLACGLDLYGNLAGAILWGRSQTKEPLYFDNVATDAQQVEDITKFIGAVHRSHHTSVLNLDLGFGLRWNQWLNCGANLLTFKFGWEQHLYTNMNQLQNVFLPLAGGASGNIQTFDQNVYRGDLALTGFVFGVSYLY